MLEIITKADALVKKYNMLSQGDFVVVGVSGGADSMFLLNYLLAKKEEYSLRLLVANVEHGIRGEDSLKDTDFVREYCAENDVEFRSLSINAPLEAKACGMGVEEYSRQKRYEFFNSFSPDKIATAHNLSDDVETALFRITRGTSLKGLCAIPPVREKIIRPLLRCSSSEIRNACRELKIPYCIDSTNSDNDYSRNRIRNKIVPEFQQINPSFEQTSSRLIDTITMEDDCLDSIAQDCFSKSFNDGVIDIARLKEYHPAIIRRAIVKFLATENLSVDACHLDGVFDLLNKSGKFQIKGDYFVMSDGKNLRIALFDDSANKSELSVKKRKINKEEFLINFELLKNEFAFYCDCDKIVGNVSVRFRQAGDCISPANRGCTKTLKKLFNEMSINVENRDSIPIICDNKGIIGIYGYCCDDRVKVDNLTADVLLINISTED